MSKEFCVYCGTAHDGMCPPREVRTTGSGGLAESYNEACEEIKRLRKLLATQNERKKHKPCPLCGGEVMYYDGFRPCDKAFGKHFICIRCDTMFSSTIIDTIWKKRHISGVFQRLRQLKNEINCRVEHGVEGLQYLRYIEEELASILEMEK